MSRFHSVGIKRRRGLVGALAVNVSQELLPWGFGFAAGAMLIVGFVAMMAIAVLIG